MLLISRIVRLITTIIVVILVAGILLKVLGANASNSIVKDVHDVAKFLAGPFDGMFTPHSAKAAIAINWGIAAAVYFVIGNLIAGLIARAAPEGVHPAEPVA